MKKETSCGCIIFDKETHSKVLIVYEKNRNFWGFPKGHIEEGETEIETALREVKEEVGLDVDIINENYVYVLQYIIEDKQVEKTTKLFLAESKDEISAHNQEEEIEDSRWLSVKEAYDLLTHDDTKDALKSAWKDMQKVLAKPYVTSVVKRYNGSKISNVDLYLVFNNLLDRLLEERKENWYEDLTKDHNFEWHLKQELTKTIASF